MDFKELTPLVVVELAHVERYRNIRFDLCNSIWFLVRSRSRHDGEREREDERLLKEKEKKREMKKRKRAEVGSNASSLVARVERLIPCKLGKLRGDLID